MSADIEHLRAVGRAATEGPWRDKGRAVVFRGGGVAVAQVDTADPRADATFCATARNEWDGLLDEVESLRAKVARVEALLATWDDDTLGRHICWPAVPKIRKALGDDAARVAGGAA